MQLDPMENWRRLTQHYAELSDGELLALAEDFRDLTDVARQVLRDEMRKRNLGDPQTVASAPAAVANAQRDSYTFSADGADTGGDGASCDDVIWKVVLYRCNGPETAWQISEVLRRAGIESWTDVPNQYAALIATDIATDMEPRFRVLVTSDRLEEARALLAHPIPPDIIEESKAKEPEYQLPVCPGCGCPDPILKSVDPANCWKCEVCGKEWTEAVQESV